MADTPTDHQSQGQSQNALSPVAGVPAVTGGKPAPEPLGNKQSQPAVDAAAESSNPTTSGKPAALLPAASGPSTAGDKMAVLPVETRSASEEGGGGTGKMGARPVDIGTSSGASSGGKQGLPPRPSATTSGSSGKPAALLPTASGPSTAGDKMAVLPVETRSASEEGGGGTGKMGEGGGGTGKMGARPVDIGTSSGASSGGKQGLPPRPSATTSSSSGKPAALLPTASGPSTAGGKMAVLPVETRAAAEEGGGGTGKMGARPVDIGASSGASSGGKQGLPPRPSATASGSSGKPAALLPTASGPSTAGGKMAVLPVETRAASEEGGGGTGKMGARPVDIGASSSASSGGKQGLPPRPSATTSGSSGKPAALLPTASGPSTAGGKMAVQPVEIRPASGEGGGTGKMGARPVDIGASSSASSGGKQGLPPRPSATTTFGGKMGVRPAEIGSRTLPSKMGAQPVNVVEGSVEQAEAAEKAVALERQRRSKELAAQFAREAELEQQEQQQQQLPSLDLSSFLATINAPTSTVADEDSASDNSPHVSEEPTPRTPAFSLSGFGSLSPSDSPVVNWNSRPAPAPTLQVSSSSDASRPAVPETVVTSQQSSVAVAEPEEEDSDDDYDEDVDEPTPDDYLQGQLSKFFAWTSDALDMYKEELQQLAFAVFFHYWKSLGTIGTPTDQDLFRKTFEAVFQPAFQLELNILAIETKSATRLPPDDDSASSVGGASGDDQREFLAEAYADVEARYSNLPKAAPSVTISKFAFELCIRFLQGNDCGKVLDLLQKIRPVVNMSDPAFLLSGFDGDPVPGNKRKQPLNTANNQQHQRAKLARLELIRSRLHADHARQQAEDAVETVTEAGGDAASIASAESAAMTQAAGVQAPSGLRGTTRTAAEQKVSANAANFAISDQVLNDMLVYGAADKKKSNLFRQLRDDGCVVSC